MRLLRVIWNELTTVEPIHGVAPIVPVGVLIAVVVYLLWKWFA